MQCIEALLISRGLIEANKKVRSSLRLFHLEGLKNFVSTELNRAQSRKLSTIIALLSGSSVVCLDESTTGMDPASRRQVWRVLHEAKAGRSIIFITIFLEEADFLSDRILFLNEGEILIAGSSMFLRKTLGSRGAT
uniref:ABC transporter domain-containing protein n=1 Tax=Macrostomum lignano TaxID=282301 RepID=A0A1I8FWV2_9PLAT